MLVPRRGVVATGNGRFTGYMAVGPERFDAAIGLACVPGSLNVRLRHPIRLARPRPLGLPLWHDAMVFCPAVLNGLSVRVIVPYRRFAVYTSAVDIVSDVHLRSAFGLTDGHEVTLEFEPSEVRPIPEAYLVLGALGVLRPLRRALRPRR